MVQTLSVFVAAALAATVSCLHIPVRAGSGASKGFAQAMPVSRVQLSHGGNGGNIGGNNGGWGGGGGGDDEEGANPWAYAGVLGNLWQGYNEALESQPILTKACTSLVGFTLGDVIAQKLVQKVDHLDAQRVARLASFGFLIHGTVSHFFYNKLDEVIPGREPFDIAAKVFTDQVLWAPIFTLVFLSWMGITAGKSSEVIKEDIKANLVKGVTTSWKVWPLAHVINFKYVPTSQRLLYINSIQIGYNVFLSMLGSGKA